MIAWIAENLLPIKVVDENEQGVYLQKGQYLKTVEAGMYWYRPFLDEVQTVNVTTQIIDLPDIAVTLKDGTVWAISAAIEYTITDACKALLAVQNFDESLQTVATKATCEFAQRAAFVDDELAESIKNEIERKATDWGVSVDDFGFNSVGKCRIFKMI